MRTPNDPDPEIVAEPIVVRDEPRIAPARKNSGSPDSTVAWIMVALLGLTAVAYAIVRASRLEPEPTPPAAPVVVSETPPPARPRPAPRSRPSAPRAAAPRASDAPKAPAVVTHKEAERKVVDPIEGFDSGEAFDNPPSPGRYGQRTSGQLERSRSTPPARPNVPDPSFGRDPR